jgi:hypothetical protein
MKTKALAVPAWIEEEWSLFRYLTSPHDGHPYGEELLEGISLLTSWALVALSVLSVVAVIADALVR